MTNQLSSHNTDEVGVQVIDHELKLYTTRKAIRRHVATPEHLSVLLTTSASGAVLPPFFIYAGLSQDVVPAEALSEDQQL